MTDTKHTPGPWHKHGYVIKDQSGLAVARTNVAQTGCNESNARLIAAAPELLEAAKGVDVIYAEFARFLPELVGTEAYDLVTEAVKKARAAIAKATGH